MKKLETWGYITSVVIKRKKYFALLPKIKVLDMKKEELDQIVVDESFATPNTSFATPNDNPPESFATPNVSVYKKYNTSIRPTVAEQSSGEQPDKKPKGKMTISNKNCLLKRSVSCQKPITTIGWLLSETYNAL